MGSVILFLLCPLFLSVVAVGGLHVVCCCTFEDCEDGVLWHKPDFVFWGFNLHGSDQDKSYSPQ